MKTELGQLMYVNEGGELFLMVNGTVYGIDLNTLEVRKVIEDLQDGSFAVSESNRYVAWRTEDESTIHVMNLSNLKEVGKLTAGSGEIVKPLGFMQEDFVYGVAKEADILEDAAGNVTTPMYQIKIMDVSSDTPEVLKTYEKSGYYVSDVTIDGYTMYLNRIQYNGTAFVEADRDMIMNREGEGDAAVAVTTVTDEIKETLVHLTVQGTAKSKTLRLLTPKETVLLEDREVTIDEENTTNRYYGVRQGRRGAGY